MTIIFNDFNSDNFGLKQLTRSMDTLQEQEITESIPGVQGTVDYSMMFGQRMFQPQTITYTFQKYIYDAVERAGQEALIRNSLSRFGLSRLYDSYIPENYYFLAKCNPAITNDVQYQKLTVTLAFTCNPPFMFCEIPEGNNDEWDTFNFDYDVNQDTSFTVNNDDVVPLINPGSAAVQPKITVTGTISVTVNGNTVSFTAGTYENTLIYLLPGMNSLTLTGAGTISFEFYKELVA